MSLNRKNIIWQSANLTWSRGFYEVLWTGEDYEWDVEYGPNFEWVSTGHPTQNEAYDAWDGCGSGSYNTLPYTTGNPETTTLDALAVKATEAGLNNIDTVLKVF